MDVGVSMRNNLKRFKFEMKGNHFCLVDDIEFRLKLILFFVEAFTVLFNVSNDEVKTDE